MTTSALVNSCLRFVGLLLAQVFIFNQIRWGWGGKDYLFVFVYPLFVAMLPLRTPAALAVFLGFLMGLSVDFFSETLGLHAGALTFTAYCRSLILRKLEPRGGYSLKSGPSLRDMGASWVFRYLSFLLLTHLAAFFLLQTFSLYFFTEILLKTAISLPASVLVLSVLMFVFNPKA